MVRPDTDFSSYQANSIIELRANYYFLMVGFHLSPFMLKLPVSVLPCLTLIANELSTDINKINLDPLNKWYYKKTVTCEISLHFHPLADGL